MLEDRRNALMRYEDEVWLFCFALALPSQLYSRIFLPTLTGGKPELAERQLKIKASFKVITLKIIQPLQIILQLNSACITACLECSKNCHMQSSLCLPYCFCCVSDNWKIVVFLLRESD